MAEISDEWSKLFSYRYRIHKKYKEIWEVPLVKKRSILLKRYLKDGMAVLDAGAGMKGIKDEIADLGIHVTYKSMDIDRSNEHDFYDVADIHEKFDAIIMFEVIEHLDLENGLQFLKGLSEKVKDKGIIIVSTPNIFNPSRYMRDSTHKIFYGYDELCGLLNLAGFGIKDVCRSFNDAIHRYILKVHILGWLFRVLSIDYALSVFVVGEKE
ncbi:MAG: class I SAM-dependent methyltransferase [Syntrophobacterales bacterium]|jgi:2-polyprenyl-3-methyl-5-hydroxy-6-metoxy-1,4-benzoquinol methylase|nr:class I SAM-dependent methyltransferase [Syntrophobacterales bacterium]